MVRDVWEKYIFSIIFGVLLIKNLNKHFVEMYIFGLDDTVVDLSSNFFLKRANSIHIIN
jgi:hypothetical protein